MWSLPTHNDGSGFKMSNYQMLLITQRMFRIGAVVVPQLASDTRGPWFESSHCQIFYSNHMFTVDKSKIKKKRR